MTPPPSRREPAKPAFLWVFVGALAAVVALKFGNLRQPPVWDTAMGVMPPAIWLYRNGFDLMGLMELPGWVGGGPNVFTISLITWLTSAAIAAVGGTLAWIPVMHTLHFLGAAVAVALAYRLACDLHSRLTAGLVALSILLVPVFLTQAGNLYLEMPLAACSLAALLCASRSRHARAAIWATVAVAIKPTGLVVAGVVVAVCGLRRGMWRERLGRASVALVGPVAVIALNFVGHNATGASPWEHTWTAYLYDCVQRMRTVPDVLAMVAFVGVVAVLAVPKIVAALQLDASPENQADRTLAVTLLAVLSFVAFVMAVPLGGRVQPLLPRHTVQIIAPLLLAGSGVIARVLAHPSIASRLPHRLSRPDAFIAAGAALLCVLFSLNAGGRWYPREHRSFAVAERSAAYRDFLFVQQKAVSYAETLPADVDVFYPLPDHYFLSDPLMGYAAAPLPRGHCVRFEEPYRHGRLADFPAKFVVMATNPYHGGEALRRVLDAARTDPSRAVIEQAVFTRGGYETRIVRVVPATRRPESFAPRRQDAKSQADRQGQHKRSDVLVIGCR